MKIIEEEVKSAPKLNDYISALTKALSVSAIVWTASQVVDIPGLKTTTIHIQANESAYRESTLRAHEVLSTRIQENTNAVSILDTRREGIQNTLYKVEEDSQLCKNQLTKINLEIDTLFEKVGHAKN